MTMTFNTEELKRKLDSDESLGSPQKLLKRSSSDQFSDFYSPDQFPLSYDEDCDDSVDDEMDDSAHEDSINQEQQPDQQKEQEQKQQQPVTPQRKKPGRKPNPASPALRKAQNRAAQRAFRERKERHLRELENTIKSLRESQYETIIKFQREYAHYRSLIEQLENENSFLKEIAFTFECALNQLNGNNDATTKMRNALSLSRATTVPSSLPLNGNVIGATPFGLGAMQMRNLPSQQSVPTAQQIQNTYLGLLQSQPTVNSRGLNINNITPPTTTIMSPPNGSSNISTASVSNSSSPQTPDSVITGSISPSSTFFAEEIAREMSLADMKTFVASTSNLQISHEPLSLFTDGDYTSSNPSVFKPDLSQSMTKSDSTASTVSTISSNGNTPSYMAEAAQFIENDADYFSSCYFNEDAYIDDGSKQLFSNLDFSDLSTPDQNIAKKKLSKEGEQILRMSKKLGQTVPSPCTPKIRYPLTDEQMHYLKEVPHDSRIDMIPCYHLRSRMIQYRDHYDINELFELLINKAKCHGDPLDPNSWELPEEFFERYGVLVFQHCRIKSSLYKRFGHLPKDFDNLYKKGEYSL